MEFIAFLIYCIVFGFITASAAENRGRDWGIWWAAGFCLGILGLLLALILPKEAKALEKEALNSGEMRKCPFCAEAVKSQASICRYCHHELPPLSVAKLVREQRIANMEFEEQKSHFLFAVRFGDESAVTDWLEADSTLANITNSDGKSPLHLAAQEGRLEIAELLISHGANILSKDTYGKTPLQVSEFYENEKLIKLLKPIELPYSSESELSAQVEIGDNSSESSSDAPYVENMKPRLIKYAALAALFISLFIAAYIIVAAVNDPKSETINQLRIASFFGKSEAKYQLGFRYSTGDGVEKNANKAVDLWNKSAQNGNVNSQVSLGFAYLHGEGISQDFSKAIYFMNKAAEQGKADVATYLGGIYFNGEYTPKDIPKAIDYFSSAAALNEPQAQGILGELYYNGSYVTQDKPRGLDLLKRAAAQGNEYAKLTLASITLNPDVTAFIDRRDGCDHFRGEEPYNEERRKFLTEKFEELCDGTDNQLAKLKEKYAAIPSVMTELQGYDPQIEIKIPTGFDCSKARTNTEHIICSSPELIKADSEMVLLYKGALERAMDKTSFKQFQSEWRNSIRNLCQDVQCLQDAYQARINQLR